MTDWLSAFQRENSAGALDAGRLPVASSGDEAGGDGTNSPPAHQGASSVLPQGAPPPSPEDVRIALTIAGATDLSDNTKAYQALSETQKDAFTKALADLRAKGETTVKSDDDIRF